MNEIEMWRSAQEFIRLHGTDAVYVAGDLAAARRADGNPDGARLWRLVEKAITELSRTEPSGHDLLN
jgi:hypothetical protein